MAHGSMGGGGGGGATDILSLSNLQSIDLEELETATAGIRVQTDGTVQEIVSNLWTSQNPGTEWIDAFVSTAASDYEVQLVKSSGFDPSAGPALTSWHTISTLRQWTWSTATSGLKTFNGTLTIREIADTGNSVSASVNIQYESGVL